MNHLVESIVVHSQQDNVASTTLPEGFVNDLVPEMSPAVDASSGQVVHAGEHLLELRGLPNLLTQNYRKPERRLPASSQSESPKIAVPSGSSLLCSRVLPSRADKLRSHVVPRPAPELEQSLGCLLLNGHQEVDLLLRLSGRLGARCSLSQLLLSRSLSW